VQRSQRIRCDTFRVRRQRYPRNSRRRPSRVEAFVTVTRSRASRVGGRYSRQCPRERGIVRHQVRRSGSAPIRLDLDSNHAPPRVDPSTVLSSRSQIFDTLASPGQPAIAIPFAPTARLSLVQVDDVARMLTILAQAAELPQRIYNSPAEVWETQHLANLVEQVTKVPVRLGEAQGGPIPDGTRCVHDFGFRLGGVADYLSSSRGTSPTLRSILEP